MTSSQALRSDDHEKESRKKRKREKEDEKERKRKKKKRKQREREEEALEEEKKRRRSEKRRLDSQRREEEKNKREDEHIDEIVRHRKEMKERQKRESERKEQELREKELKEGEFIEIETSDRTQNKQTPPSQDTQSLEIIIPSKNQLKEINKNCNFEDQYSSNQTVHEFVEKVLVASERVSKGELEVLKQKYADYHKSHKVCSFL